MLTYFTCLSTRRILSMAFRSRSIVSLINGIQNNSRPFDEILFSFDSTTHTTSLNNDNHYFDTNPVKGSFT